MKRLHVATLLTLLLAACGGGGGATPVLPADESPTASAPLRVLVQMRDGDEDEVDEVAQDTGALLIGPVEGTTFFLFELPDGMTVARFQSLLDDDARVVGSAEDEDVSSPEGGGATLPLGGDLFASQIPEQEELLRIGIRAAHERATGVGVRIAVVDSGVLPDHEFLAGRIEAGGWDFVDGDPDPTDEPNGIDDDGDGLIDEGYGHGTFVSSLILAVAPDARILPFRVLNDDSFGRASDIAQAITAAVSAGVDVINISAGMETRVDVVKEAANFARSRGVLVIVSAGNTGREDVTFPASVSEAVSVTSVDGTDAKASFASFGGDVDLSAPGEALLGAFPSEIGTARWSGTSFSAALVSGACALVLERFPLLRAEEALDHLLDHAVDVDARNPELTGRLGRGRLDLDAATSP